ncbi:GumC family protein [Mongoliitalea lutea]|uniref:non-specific protein-tyrosine kinase n=1 Tax=Mongoliitalea lutea TaxID=849756 RepID=A0A8J3CX09_9BACT|nr:tyrosine-protein kinase [Mongoliitalea lutea]GHB31463.1 sugar transporter [Mongoliitalea lutea]
MNDNYTDLKDKSSIDFRAIFPKILRIWPLILLSVFLFAAAGYLIVKFTTPVYKVSGLFFVKERSSGFSIFEGPSMLNNSNLGLQNEIIIIKSKPITRKTLNELDFNVEYYEKGSYTYNELYANSPLLVEIDWKSPQIINTLVKVEWSDDSQFKLSFNERKNYKYLPNGSTVPLTLIPEPTLHPFNEWIETSNYRIKVTKTTIDESGSIYIKVRDTESLVWEYSGKLQVNRLDRNASILNLSMDVQNYQKGTTFLNHLMEKYMDLELEEKNEVSSNTIDFIDSQVSGVADSLKLFESQLQAFRSTNKIYDLQSESTIVYEQLLDYETRLQQEQFKRQYYSKLKDYLVRENYRELVVPSGLGIDDPILNGLITSLITLQNKKSELLATNTEQSPVVREIERKVKELNSSIRESLINVDQSSKFVIENLTERKAAIESSFRNLPETEQNLIRFKRQFDLTENIYNFLMQKRAESAISKASNKADNKIIEPASFVQQIKPQLRRTIILFSLVGFMLPVGLVILIQIFKTKIEELEYLEQHLKIPVLTSIMKNQKPNNLVVFEQSKSGIAEGFRTLRANIRFLHPADEKVVIMVTSSVSGEGKTFCSINLASVYALTGKKTILVGCDMRKPRIFDDFKLENSQGLSTYLSGQVSEWDSMVNPSGYENLDILLSGPIPPNPAELLYSANFGKLIEELKGVYDVVILDTPPVGLVSETLGLISFVDLSLFVFRQNYSERGFIDALNSLKAKNSINNLYAIYNGVDGRRSGYGYGNSYGYGYYDDSSTK